MVSVFGVRKKLLESAGCKHVDIAWTLFTVGHFNTIYGVWHETNRSVAVLSLPGPSPSPATL